MKTVSYVLSGLCFGGIVGFLAGAAFLAIAATLSSEAYDGMGLILFGMIGTPIGAIIGIIVGVILSRRVK